MPRETRILRNATIGMASVAAFVAALHAGLCVMLIINNMNCTKDCAPKQTAIYTEVVGIVVDVPIIIVCCLYIAGVVKEIFRFHIAYFVTLFIASMLEIGFMIFQYLPGLINCAAFVIYAAAAAIGIWYYSRIRHQDMPH